MGDIPPGDPVQRNGPEEEGAYEKYRARYEHVRDELMRRDRQVQGDPFAMARWPSERKVFADRVEQALTEWQVLGHKSAVEARRSGTEPMGS
jgi:hypothetical protein